jgi:PAS domain S-box-containing protein
MDEATVARRRGRRTAWPGKGTFGPAVRPLRSGALRFALAVACLCAVIALQFYFRRVTYKTPFLFLLGTIAFAGWYCGPAPGLLLTLLSALFSAYFFIGPHKSVSIEHPYDWLTLVGFIGVALTLTAITAAARGALFEAEHTGARLEALSADLLRSEKSFRGLADAIPQIVWTANADGVIDYFNQRLLEYIGGAADLPNDFLNEFRRGVFPEDRKRIRARWREVTRAGAPFEVEFRIRRGSDGTYRWFLARGLPLKDEAGRVVKWFGTSTDIHDQRVRADRSRFLAQASDTLASSLDYEQTLGSVAAAAVPQFADWATADLVENDGSIRRVAVAHGDPKKVQLAWSLFRKFPLERDAPTGVSAVVRTGSSRYAFDLSDADFDRSASPKEYIDIVRKLGLRSAMLVPLVARGRTLGAITFVMAESGRRFGRDDLAVAEDLGRRVGCAVENARLYRDSLEASRLKDEFLSTLSHELRTPLTSVLGWASMLTTSEYSPERLQRGLQAIQRNARAQAQLIEDLLDLSRIVTGKLRLEVRTFEPADAVAAAIETVRPSAELKHVQLTSVLEESAGPIAGDPDRVQQIVWNLLNNAIKFTPRGGRVHVTLQRAGAEVAIEVADSGQGIAPDFLPHVFERFRQADASVSRAQGGLGLGLAIVRHLVELHGGTIEAKSAGAGQGATFRVLLPVTAGREDRRRASAAQGLADQADAQAFGEDGALAGVSALVVDDACDAREMVAEGLRQRGASVQSAADAREALELLGKQRFDMLVSDIGMPDMDGFALIRAVRQLPPEANGHIHAIALTAYAHATDRARALVEGFDLHLPKPIDPAELTASVASMMRRRS